MASKTKHMTPQAQEIVDRFKPYVSYMDGNRNVSTDTIQTDNAIRCAIVAVEFAIKYAIYNHGDNLHSILTELKNEL